MQVSNNSDNYLHIIRFFYQSTVNGIKVAVISGLQRRFRHIVPHQLYINCRNHKLALCVKHLIKSFPVVQVVDELLIGLWKMFHYSPKKFATLQEVQTSYGLTHLKLIKACSTRWLSHGKACIRLVERFVQVI
jgi:hypothetical protein